MTLPKEHYEDSNDHYVIEDKPENAISGCYNAGMKIILIEHGRDMDYKGQQV